MDSFKLTAEMIAEGKAIDEDGNEVQTFTRWIRFVHGEECRLFGSTFGSTSAVQLYLMGLSESEISELWAHHAAQLLIAIWCRCVDTSSQTVKCSDDDMIKWALGVEIMVLAMMGNKGGHGSAVFKGPIDEPEIALEPRLLDWMRERGRPC